VGSVAGAGFNNYGGVHVAAARFVCIWSGNRRCVARRIRDFRLRAAVLAVFTRDLHLFHWAVILMGDTGCNKRKRTKSGFWQGVLREGPFSAGYFPGTGTEALPK